MSLHPLTEQQAAAVALRGRSVLVSAAAGAGKTLVLVRRLMEYMTDPDDPRDIDEFLLITYTRAAAGEMRARILRELRGRLAASPGDAHLKRQMNKLYTTHISTLHSYCLDLLREFSARSALPPDIRVADDAELAALRESAMDRALEELYAELAGAGAGKSSETKAFGAFADAFSDMKGDEQLADQIERVWFQTRWRRHDKAWRDRELARCRDAGYWEAMLLEYAVDLTARWLSRLKSVREAIDGPVLEKAYGSVLDADISRLSGLINAVKRDWDAAAGYLAGYSFDKLGSAAKAEDRELASAILNVRNVWKADLKKLGALICCSHAENAGDLQATARVLEGLFYAAGRFEERYRQEKEWRRVADFSDIESAALELLVSEDGGPTETGKIVQRRFREIMVDEYQDINPAQDAIIDALSCGCGNVFYVGDARQSIYRFQFAEPSIFVSKLENFPDYREGGTGPRKVELTGNFRSDGQIIEAVNSLFGRVMRKKSAEMDYGLPLEAKREPVIAQEPLVELVIVEMGKENETSAIETEARAVASRLNALILSGEARARDCVILLSSFRSRAPSYHAALTEFGLDSVSDAQNESFFTAGAVRGITSMLEVIQNPRSDISMLAALRCAALAYTPEELAGLRASSGGDLFDCLLADPSPKSEWLREKLDGWRELAPEVPVWRLISRVLADTGLYSRVDGRGQAELDAYCELAAGCPYGGELPGFLDWLSRREGGVNVASAPSGDAVRIMSVHKSKGLEFPVVVVADMSKRYNLKDCQARLLIHRELGCALKRRLGAQEYPTVAHNALRRKLEFESRAEELRVLYVAMTRAEKRLILSGKAVEGINTDFDPDPFDTLASKASSHMQIQLTVNSEQLTVIREEDIEYSDKAAPPSSAAAPLSTIHYPLSTAPYPHAAAVNLPSKLTVTGLKGRYADEEALEYTIRPTPDSIVPLKLRSGLTAVQRGQAVHLAMQYLDFTACADLSGVKGELARLREAGVLSREQYEAVSPKKIAAFFESDLGKRVLSSDRVWRECKFSMLEPAELLTNNPDAAGEEILFQGVVDCFFEENGRIILLDFKTDRINPGDELLRAEMYGYQLEAYARAVLRMTGLQTDEKYVWFFATGTGVMLY